MAKEKAEVTREDIVRLGELAKHGITGQLDALLEKQKEIGALDFETLKKMSVLMPITTNGICGLACSPCSSH